MFGILWLVCSCCSCRLVAVAVGLFVCLALALGLVVVFDLLYVWDFGCVVWICFILWFGLCWFR